MLGEFTQNVDFKCNADICFGVGAANHLALQQLQQAINMFAISGGFSSITQDGFIGVDTVTAAQGAAIGVANFLGGSLPGATQPEIVQLANGNLSREQIAANAPLLTGIFNAAGTLLRQARTAAGEENPPIIPIPGAPDQPSDIPGTPGAAAATTIAGLSKKTALWIAGGAAAAILVGGTTYFLYRRSAVALGRRRRSKP